MNYIRYTFLYSLWMLFLLFQEPTMFIAEPQEKARKPAVQVSFERQSIRENDSIKAHIWLSNESNQALTSLKMHVAAPDFLKWHEDSCAGAEFSNTLELNPVQPNQILTFTVCMKTGSRIVVGEFNTLFTFEYTWQEPNKNGRSFVTVEKPLKANLFGSDTIAGVPLALASYIVPGLFFWIVTAYFKAPWSIKDESLGNQLIYNLLVSLVIVLVWNKLRFPDVNSGISLRELSIYAVLGTVSGILTSGSYAVWRRILRQRNQRHLIVSTDSDEVILEKLLRQSPARSRPKTTIRFSDGREFIGSLAMSTDSLTALVGWFRIDPETIPAVDKPEFARLYKEKRLLELLQLARARKVPLEPLETIYEVRGDRSEPSGIQGRTWQEGRQGIRMTEATGDWEAIEIR